MVIGEPLHLLHPIHSYVFPYFAFFVEYTRHKSNCRPVLPFTNLKRHQTFCGSISPIRIVL